MHASRGDDPSAPCCLKRGKWSGRRVISPGRQHLANDWGKWGQRLERAFIFHATFPCSGAMPLRAHFDRVPASASILQQTERVSSRHSTPARLRGGELEGLCERHAFCGFLHGLRGFSHPTRRGEKMECRAVHPDAHACVKSFLGQDEAFRS